MICDREWVMLSYPNFVFVFVLLVLLWDFYFKNTKTAQ